jgi:hypothetical protein
VSAWWAIFIAVTLVAFAIGFFMLGFVVGEDVAHDDTAERQIRLLEAERALRDIDRAAFISMLAAAEARAQGNVPKRAHGYPERSRRELD